MITVADETQRWALLARVLEEQDRKQGPAIKAARVALRDAKPLEIRPCAEAPALFDDLDDDEVRRPNVTRVRVERAADLCLDCPVFVQCSALRDLVIEQTKPAVVGVLAGRLVSVTDTGRMIDRAMLGLSEESVA